MADASAGLLCTAVRVLLTDNDKNNCRRRPQDRLVCEQEESAQCTKNHLCDGHEELFDKLLCHPITSGNSAEEGRLPFEQDDCRKKRCVDRYDSSESSDSGVAVLSCTDCSGSSTASSDITDPGSPFSSTSSTHSEDSGSAQQQVQKMPPTQTSSHHPLWPWTTVTGAEETGRNAKRSLLETTKTANTTTNHNNNNHCTNKRHKSSSSSIDEGVVMKACDTPHASPNVKKTTAKVLETGQKQGKITEYFKTQMKLHVIKDQKCKNDQQTQFNGMRPNCGRTAGVRNSTAGTATKNRKVTVPRKILPAPTKIPETFNHHQLAANFTPTVTLTALSFPPNLTYLHAKTPKPPDAANPIFMPQFATIPNSKLNAIPTLNVIQPMQNFNCVKLNATVVPIVKLNSLTTPNHRVVSVETAMPTVLTAKPKLIDSSTSTRIEVEDQVTSSSSGTGDSDSGISVKGVLEIGLEVSVAAEAILAQPSQKSPILSQPKTIRFPALKREEEGKETGKTTPTTQDRGLCRWEGCCSAQFDTSGALLEHLQVKHVISQASQEHYVCLWLGCKVHGRTSCSRSWLERHVLAHAGTKPFRCIVDGCGQRFNSQLTLERHVNNHFSGDSSQTNSAKKSTDNAACKLFKRNGKKIRFRRQPWSARMFDFMDAGIMEGLQHKLLKMTQERTLGQIHNAGNTVNVLSEVIAKRVEPTGRVQFLIRWHPADILPEEWVPESEYVAQKSVPIPSLETCSKDVLAARLFPPRHTTTSASSTSTNKRKRRKPTSIVTTQPT